MKLSRVLSLIVCLSLLLSALPAITVFSEEKETTVIACSDFQSTSGSTQGMMNMKYILMAMKNDGIKSADGFLCCGDYDVDTYGDLNSTKEGVRYMKMALTGIVSEENMVWVQGNHDAPANADSGLSPSGENDHPNR